MRQPLLQAKRLDQLVKIIFIWLSAIQLQRQREVFFRVQDRDEVVKLVDQSDLPAAEDGQCGLIHLIDVAAVDEDLTAVRAVHAAQHMQQGALS